MRITTKGASAAAAVLVALAACGLEGTDLGDLLSRWAAPLPENGGFEVDGGSLTGWTVTPRLNATGLAAVPPTSLADLQLSAGGIVLTFARTDPTPESQPFQGMTPAADIPRWPKFGTTSAVVNESNGQNSTNANSLKQSYTVTNADVDPSDGEAHVRFVLAPALQAAGHAPTQQPYYFVTLRNLTTGATLFTDFSYAHNPGVPWKSQGTGPAAVLYTDWVIHDIAPGNVALRVGDQVELEVIAARCQPGDHFGEVYVDGFGSTFAGLSIRKDAPPLANVDSDITYSFVVQNNTSTVAPNVVADETLPAGTTFVSASTSTPGASCTTPVVGGTGVVSCSFGSMNPGAVGRFLVRVRAYPAAPNGSGTATAGAAGSLTDSTKAWTPDAFAGWTAYLVGGTGVGQSRVIFQNTATQLTVTPAWTTAPDNTTAYKIVNPPQERGTVSGRTGNTLVDGAKSWAESQWVGYTVTVLSGAGAGQQRLIASNTSNQLTVDTSWSPNLGLGATYALGLPPDKVVNGNYTVRGDAISPVLGPKVETVITAAVQLADLRIVKTDGVAAVDWGSPVRYTVTVTNAGPLPVTGARVTDIFPPELTSITWTCAAAGGGTCGMASGSGDINATLNLLSLGATVTFTVNATVIAGSGTGRLINVASVTAPAGFTDLDPRNNSDADIDTIGTLVLLTVNKDPADGGRGTVTSSPAAINCGPACTSATAPFGLGTVVTLTAVARAGDTFTGWAGACAGAAITCDVTMDQAKTVTAHFRGPRVIGVAGPGGTISCNPLDVVRGGSSVCTITPDADHILLSVTDNGSTVTGSVSNGTYTVANVITDHTVSVTFDARPNFGGPAPTTAAENSTYVYTPVVTDPDGPVPLTIAVDPSDTCAGVLNPVDGRYSFNPGAEETCVVAITACDAAGACRTQRTTVTVNHLPIAVDDTVITAGPIDIPGGTLTANDAPGGSGAEASQTLTVTSVSAGTAAGGIVALIGGVVTYTPPPGFLGTDTFTYTVTDGGDPALSATATVTVTVTVAGFLDGMGASGGGCGCSASAELAALPWYGIPALLVLVRRRRLPHSNPAQLRRWRRAS